MEPILNTEMQVTEEKQTMGELKQFLTFLVNRETFGITLSFVHEILKPVYITRIPNAEEYILGVINLRGEIIPILDLRQKFEQGFTPVKKETRIIVVHLNEKKIGLLVDEVLHVVKIEASNISYTTDELALNYNKMTESVSRHEDKLILNLGMKQIIDFI
jgi:purine-binding chemotaxis protein CheW